VDDVGLKRGMLVISSLWQVVAHQSTERHDSEHRGPAVVAFGAVS
jgi:hypothetical protein